jgi:hypothetical protein
MNCPITDPERRANLMAIGIKKDKNLSVAHFSLYREKSRQL